MKIRVFGASGSEAPGHNPPAFLVDDALLLDAGTISHTLDIDGQCAVSHIFLTHAHLDHVKGIPFLVDNMVLAGRGSALTVWSGREVLSTLHRDVFNGRLWPDFTRIPSPEAPVLRLRSLTTRSPVAVNGHRVLATRVNHSVPAFGYIVEDALGTAMLYTGDTGPTERIWERMKGFRVRVIITEASFPNAMESLARVSGHMTPGMLAGELAKLPYMPERVCVTHVKPQFRETIRRELQAIRGVPLEVLEDESVIAIAQ